MIDFFTTMSWEGDGQRNPKGLHMKIIKGKKKQLIIIK